jgi:hypothetical protein
MKTLTYLALSTFLFFLFPSFQMSYAGQITEKATQASEIAQTANPGVGSGGWIGSSFFGGLFFICLGFFLLTLVLGLAQFLFGDKAPKCWLNW